MRLQKYYLTLASPLFCHILVILRQDTFLYAMYKFRFSLLVLLLALTSSLSAQHTDTISISHCTTIDQTLSARLDARARRLLADTARHIRAIEAILTRIDNAQVLAWPSYQRWGQNIRPQSRQRKAATGALMLLPTASMAMTKTQTAPTDSVNVGNGVLEVGNPPVKLRDHNWRTGGSGMITYADAVTTHSVIGYFRLLEKIFDADVAADLITQPTMGNANVSLSFYNVVYGSLYNGGHPYVPNLNGETTTQQVSLQYDEATRQLARTLIKGRSGYLLRRSPAAQENMLMLSAQMAAGADDRQMGIPYAFEGVALFPADAPQYCLSVRVKTDSRHPWSSIICEAIHLLVKAVEGGE